MEQKEYKAIFVRKDTHKKFAIVAREQEMTFDELINYLIELCKKKKQ